MISVRDFERLEGSRGIGYLCLAAAAFGPSFIAVYLYADSVLLTSFSVGVTLAIAMGVSVTALLSAVAYMPVALEDAGRGRDRGARVIARSSGYAIVVQAVALIATSALPATANIRTYMVYLAILLVWPIVDSYRATNKLMPEFEARTKKAQELEAELDEIARESDGLQRELDELDSTGNDPGRLTAVRKKMAELSARMRDVKQKLDEIRR
jgi:hypothetical protein